MRQFSVRVPPAEFLAQAPADFLTPRKPAWCGRGVGALEPHGEADLATSRKNYADLLRETGRGTEAAKMEARAKAIWAKHAR